MSSVFDRQVLRLREPNQRDFVPFDGQQVAHHLGLSLLARFVCQRGAIIGLGIDLAVERGDRCPLVQPNDQRDRCLADGVLRELTALATENAKLSADDRAARNRSRQAANRENEGRKPEGQAEHDRSTLNADGAMTRDQIVREIALDIKIGAQAIALKRLAHETAEIYDELIRCKTVRTRARLPSR